MLLTLCRSLEENEALLERIVAVRKLPWKVNVDLDLRNLLGEWRTGSMGWFSMARSAATNASLADLDVSRLR
jgi:hypothetical protein